MKRMKVKKIQKRTNEIQKKSWFQKRKDAKTSKKLKKIFLEKVFSDALEKRDILFNEMQKAIEINDIEKYKAIAITFDNLNKFIAPSLIIKFITMN